MRAALVLALIAGSTSSCATHYGVRFVPAPLEIRLDGPNESEDLARVLLSVRGVRRASEGEPARVEIRMRLENLGQSTLQLEADSLRLVAADLAPFEPGSVLPPAPEPIEPGGGATYDIHFPFPAGKRAGESDLSGLNLEWTTRFADRRLVTGASFQRAAAPRDVYFYDAYPYPYPYCWRIGGGVRIGRFSED